MIDTETASDATLTPAQLQQRHQAPTKHGLESTYATTGDTSALQTAQRSRLVELRELVQTREGVISLLQERVIRAVAVCEFAEDWLQAESESGKGGAALFALPMMQRYFTAGAEARRALGELIKVIDDEGDGGDVTRILEQLKK